MQACFVFAGKLKLTSKQLPKLRDRWALVRVRFAGICNTDVEIFAGYHDFRGTPGTNLSAKVAEVRGVLRRERDRWLGRRVVGEDLMCLLGLRLSAVWRFLQARIEDALCAPNRAGHHRT